MNQSPRTEALCRSGSSSIVMIYAVFHIAVASDVVTPCGNTAKYVGKEHRSGGGGAAGTRTPYLFNAIEALSQMSYSPTRADSNQLTAVMLSDCRITA